MSSGYSKTEGGHKRGHSNCVHWDGTEEIKIRSKRKRRQQSKKLTKIFVGDSDHEKDDRIL